MKAFFKSGGFKVLVGIFSLLLVISIVFSLIGQRMSPESGFFGSIIVPVQHAATVVSRDIEKFFTVFNRVDRLEDENNSLRQQLQEQAEMLEKYDEFKSENDYLYDFLDLKRDNPDFQLLPSDIVSFDAATSFGNFTINKGSSDGVAVNDPIVTSVHLKNESSGSKDTLIGYCVVGYIAETASEFSTVMTILDPSLSVGAADSRTHESGVVSGSPELAAKKLCKMSYLTAMSSVTVGDTVITSGDGGIFPQGLTLGTISSIKQEITDISLYAEVQPAVDFLSLEHAMVLTSFDGQGGKLQ